MPFNIDSLKTDQIRNLVRFLRQIKLNIIDCFKMQINYGIAAQAIYGSKKILSRFRKKFVEKSVVQFPLDTNFSKNAQVKKNKRTFEIPHDLSAQLEKAKSLYEIDKYTFSNPSTIIFISYSLPRFDRTAAEQRLYNILNLLLVNGLRIEFVYCTKLYGDEKYSGAFKGDITFRHLPLDHDSYIRFLTERNPQYVWITELWRLNYFKFMVKLTETLKDKNYLFKVIVDTIDFHSKEFFRKYKWSNNQDDMMRANEFLKIERLLYKAADCVIVVTETEKKDIQSQISGIKDFEIIPTIHEISNSTRPHNKRRNMCFVGHFGNKHNVDAVTYFIENIFQLILDRNPNVEFHVLGYSSDKYKSVFKSPGVKVIGGLKYLEKALTYYKLFVCPMRYGAGLKGKIGGAVAAGVPVVTTSIGAEGFPFRDGEECFIADASFEFAEKCNQCLTDPAIWQKFSVKSRLMIAENFSPAVVAGKLRKVLSNN